jgi:hypothetical protein
MGRPDDPETTWFEPHRVKVRVDLLRPISFSGTEAEFNSNKVINSSSAKAAFNASKASVNDALDIWRRTLRWIALSPHICISDIQSPFNSAKGRSLKIQRKRGGAIFRNHGGVWFVPVGGKVTIEAWAVVSRALQSQTQPPMWIDYLLEVHRARAAGNLREAIVNAAVAAEVVVRKAFASTLPAIPSLVASRSTDSAGIQSLLHRWEEVSGWDRATRQSRGKGEVHELFDLRNEVMHDGLNIRERLGAISRLLPRVSEFVLASDAHLAQSAADAIRPSPWDGSGQWLTSSRSI